MLVLPEDAGMIALIAGNAVLCAVTAVVSGMCALSERCSPGWWAFSNAVTLLFGWLVRHAAQTRRAAMLPAAKPHWSLSAHVPRHF